MAGLSVFTYHELYGLSVGAMIIDFVQPKSPNCLIEIFTTLAGEPEPA
jgi:hypothetical protein